MPTAALVATSCATLRGTDRHTGVALSQFGLVYDTLTRSGWRAVTASPAGGAVPVDAGGLSEEWAVVTDRLGGSIPLQDLAGADVYAWVVLGGHGALVDLPEEPFSARLLTRAVFQLSCKVGFQTLFQPGIPCSFLRGARTEGNVDAGLAVHGRG